MMITKERISGLIIIIAVLAMGVTALAREKNYSDRVTKGQGGLMNPGTSYTISGSITASKSAKTNIGKKNCSDVIVNVLRETIPGNTTQPPHTATIATTKAAGGLVENGCTYSVSAKRGSKTSVAAFCPTFPSTVLATTNGVTDQFDLTANTTRDIFIDVHVTR